MHPNHKITENYENRKDNVGKSVGRIGAFKNTKMTSDLNRTPAYTKPVNKSGLMMTDYNTNRTGGNKTPTNVNKSFNFFNTSNKNKTTKAPQQNQLVNEYNSATVKQYNAFTNNVDTYKFLNPYKETGIEKSLIPHPKKKVQGFRNPYASQIKIA